MAIINSMWLKGSKKRLGGTVIYQAMGQTRQRELAAEVSNPRTQSQMNQRVKWANLVNFYRANRSWMKYAFETKKSSQSEYNKFMSLNVASSNIYLTKQQAAAGACVCAPYIVTQGSLPSIEVNAYDDEWQSNIYLSAATKMDEGVSVAVLSQDLLAMNPGLREGDQLSLIRVTQQVNSVTGLPYIIVRRYEMLLDLQEQSPWNNFLPADIVGPSTSGNLDLVAVFGNEGAGGFALILSRTIAGKTYVSSQRLTIVNNETMIEAYSSDGQLSSAIASYGESDDAFLSTISASTNIQAGVPLSILSSSYRDVEHVAGSRFAPFVAADNQVLHVVFNREIPSAPEFVTVTTNARTLSCVNLRKSTTEALANFNQGIEPFEGEVIWNIRVVIDGTAYTVPFRVSDEDSIGSLE